MNETGKGVILQSKNMTLFWLISNLPPPLTISSQAKGITSVISALVASVPSEEKRCQFCWFFFLFATMVMVEEGNSVARESSRKQRSRPVGRGGKDEQRYQFGATEPVSQNDKSFLLAAAIRCGRRKWEIGQIWWWLCLPKWGKNMVALFL